MSYTVLARRYRSRQFEDVVGQEAVARTLRNAILTDRVAHAYLFTGTRGVGKTTMARIFAKALNCLAFDKPTVTPCDTCESCLAIAEGNDIDVLEIDGASNTGVEHIRELRQNAIYRPARARFKIYIIDEVHMLSVSAFNALLKTLEEPPEHVKFLFATTEANKILPTILSRCQRFDFRNLTLEEIAVQLTSVLQGEGLDAEDAVIRRIARLAHGSMRDALSLMDQLLSTGQGTITAEVLNDLVGQIRSERIFRLAQAISQNSASDAMKELDGAIAEGWALEALAQSLQDHFRDLLMIRSCGPDTELVELEEAQERKRFQDQAQQFDSAALTYAITVTEEVRRAIKAAGAGRAFLEAGIIRLTCVEQFGDVQALLKQIQQLQAGSAGTVLPLVARSPSVSTTRTSIPSPAVVNSSPVRAVQPETNPSSAIPLNASPSEITLSYLEQHWAALLQDLARRDASLPPFLEGANPTHWSGNTLTLTFGAGHKNKYDLLNAQPLMRKSLEKMWSDVLARKIQLNIQYLTAQAGNGIKTHKLQAESSDPLPPGAKPSQEQINAAIADPAVQQVQQLLGGKIRQVDRKHSPLTEGKD